MKARFKLGVITDEVSQDFEEAVKVVKELRMRLVELRELWGKNVKDLSDGELVKVKRLVDEAGLKVACIASPFFKCSLFNVEEREEHLSFLRRLIDIAKTLDAETIRVFAFWRIKGGLDKYFDAVVEGLKEAVEVAEDEGVLLALENEAACLVGTGLEARRVIDAVDSKALKINWDPANAYIAGERPYPEGYGYVRSFMAHMHIKDVVKDPETGRPRFVAIGSGDIDYKGQLLALVDDGYEGCISLETHYTHPLGKEWASRECFQGLLKLLTSLEIM